jgi:hypothetical protein
MKSSGRFLQLIGVAIVAGFAGCDDGPPRTADLTWIEPVQLASGETVNIKRHVVMVHERAFGGGYSSAPVYKTSTIEGLPNSPEFPVWDAPLVPILIDKDPATGEWIIVASIDECGVWIAPLIFLWSTTRTIRRTTWGERSRGVNESRWPRQAMQRNTPRLIQHTKDSRVVPVIDQVSRLIF